MNLDYDVVIIGAGAAGIAAGIELQKGNINFTILEARNRVGGRAYTDRETFQSTPIDLGASWIHSYGPNNVLYRYHRSLDVEKSHDNDVACTRLCVDYDGKPFTTETSGRARNIYYQIYDHLETLNYQINTNEDQSMEQAMQTTYERLITTNDSVKRLVDLHLSGEEQYDGSNLAEMSVKYWGVGCGSGGDRSVSIGYGSLLEKIANQHNLPIQLNTLVTKIDTTDAERIVLSIAENNSTISCRRLIITIPLGCLKKETILFEPPLPDWKRNAINQMGIGVMNKLVLRFPHNFWDRKIEGILHASNQRRGRFRFTLCLPPPANILILFVTGSFARELELLTDEQILEEALTFLRTIFPHKQIPHPINYKFTRWLQDPLAYGSYSNFVVHAGPHTIEKLAKTTSNERVFWAGEHANVKDDSPYWSYGCVHSAFQSGQTAAKSIRESFLVSNCKV
mgnify:CR=1 FL=1